jgi:predicted metal-dependent peptidase
VFGSPEFDRQYYELYYHKLAEQAASGQGSLGPPHGEAGPGLALESSPNGTPATDALPGPLPAYVDSSITGRENTAEWGPDELRVEQINDRIQTAAETDSWGSIPGRCKERLIASLRPRLSYRAVLRQFRASVLSIHRRLTRMKPNRRYGFAYLGSRYDFTTRLLFAVDVSGSMSSQDLARGFSVINCFFKYGVEAVDVIQFDTEIKGAPLTLKRARYRVEVSGRGGTSFDPVITFLDEHGGYDGAIIFTDGYAAVPPRPKNRRTRVLWLFNREETYNRQRETLRLFGRAAYLKEASAGSRR